MIDLTQSFSIWLRLEVRILWRHYPDASIAALARSLGSAEDGLKLFFVRHLFLGLILLVLPSLFVNFICQVLNHLVLYFQLLNHKFRLHMVQNGYLRFLTE